MKARAREHDLQPTSARAASTMMPRQPRTGHASDPSTNPALVALRRRGDFGASPEHHPLEGQSEMNTLLELQGR
jgi:hypothetical protein